MTKATRELAEKVLTVVDAGLVAGLGRPIPGQMCVEAAVVFATGQPHGDEPDCVAPALRFLKMRLNDSDWSSPMTRAKGLRRLAIAQLGSAGALDGTAFRQRVADMTIRRVVPIGLRAATTVNPAFTSRLEAAAVRCETEGTREACQAARDAAEAATATATANAAAYATAYAAVFAATATATAAAYAATAAYAAAATAYAATHAARDRVLAQYAEWVVEILIDMKAPGCEWLDLAPLDADQAIGQIPL